MLTHMKYRKVIAIISLLTIVLSLFISFAYANNDDLTQGGTSKKMQENNLVKEEVAVVKLPEPTLESDKQQVITRLDDMNHELVLLQTQASEVSNTKMSKEIIHTTNELLIEKTVILQGLKKTSKKNVISPEDSNLFQSRLLELEDKYENKISYYTDLLNTSSARKSAVVGKLDATQSILAGAQARVSIQKTSVRDSVYIEVVNSAGITILSDYNDEPTDIPSYTWSTSPTTPSGDYTIVLQYPEASEDEDEFKVHITAAPSPVNIKVDTPVNVQFASGEYSVYKYTPAESKAYQISTTAKKGGESTSDTWLGVYEDTSLSTLIQSNGDTNNVTSELVTDLKIGKPYYIAVKGEDSNRINATMTITASEVPIDIYLNSPIDIDISASNYKVFRFMQPTFGAYKIYTEYYGGNSSSGVNDTMLYLYPDENYGFQGYNELAFNDDANGKVFSEINWNMNEGDSYSEAYFIKLMGFGSKNVHARIRIVQVPSITQKVDVNAPLDISLKMFEAGLYKFTPSATGDYRMFTGSYAGGSEHNDTKLYLFEDEGFTKLIDSNDDDSEAGYNFSALNVNLIGGRTYYFALRGYENTPFHASFTVVPARDFYEPNDTPESAYPISALSTYTAMLSNSSDLDYYQFKSTFNSWVDFYFEKVPINTNYNFIVYQNNLGVLTEVARGAGADGSVKGARFRLVRNIPYIIKIYGVNGSNSTSPYSFYLLDTTIDPTKQEYRYDSAGRLKTLISDEDLYRYQVEYQYDKNGNLIKKIVTKTNK